LNDVEIVVANKRRASLLVAFAHPDDEIFHSGMLAHLSDRGVRVTLVCATDGEAGKPHPSVGPVDDLGALRVEELRRSCAHLGIDEPVLLRFHDSARKERQRHDDPHALANVDMLDVEAALRSAIADVKPHVVLTFEPHGSRRDFPGHDRGILCQRGHGHRRTRASVLRRDAPRGV
jgi:N-acetyl-1-D-myo-inositol-2-amino-2-deoxy-alpha-D-glucopyranoside deacetylase